MRALAPSLAWPIALAAAASFTLGCDECEELPDTGIGDPGRLCGAHQAELPIQLGLGLPIVAARVDGESRYLLVDTGASAPLLLSAKLLGEPDQTWTKVQSLCLGGDMCFEDVQTFAQDGPFSTDRRGDVNGIVGMALLMHLRVEIDRMESLTLRYGFAVCDGAATPLARDESHRPYAEVAVDGAAIGSTLLDTGAHHCLFDAATRDTLAAYVREDEQPASGCGVSGCAEGYSVSRVRRFCVGEVCEDDVEVKYPVWNAVGSAFFSRRHVAFDFAAERMLVCD
ncbi:MAG: hypothetical protein AABZ30_10245 [Myxococcota bacterium]